MSDIKPLWLCCLFSLLLAACNPSNNTELTVQEAWINEPAPGQTHTAGYFTLLNHTDTPMQLIGAKADIAGRIELHTVDNQNGMMRMRRIKSATVPAKGKLVFSTGQQHLMLFNLDTDLLSQKTVSITLLLDNHRMLIENFHIRRTHAGKKTPSQHH